MKVVDGYGAINAVRGNANNGEGKGRRGESNTASGLTERNPIRRVQSDILPRLKPWGSC